MISGHPQRILGLESSHVKPFRATAALGIAALLLLTSCSVDVPGTEADAGGPNTSAPNGKLAVVTTTTQLADFAAHVGGEDIEVASLVAPGASSHQFDPSPADLLRMNRADVLIINGAGLDEFIDSAIDASGFSGALIDASDGIDLAEARAITAEGLDEQASAEHGAAEHSAAEHDDEGHDGGDHHDHDEHGDHDHDHDHDHGDLNPHLWTSPRFAQGMVSQIAAGLVKADPEHGAEYRDRAAAYDERLQLLDSWIAAQFKRVPAEDRVLVTGHDSLRYYLHDYGIAYAGSLLPSFEDNAEPSAAGIDALVAEIKRSGVKAIFVESSLSPKLAQTVAKESGVKVVDAESLFVDSLGPKGSGAESYIDATLHNTRVILDAWGAHVDPVPSELEHS